MRIVAVAALLLALALATDAEARIDGPRVPEPYVAAIRHEPCPAYPAGATLGCAYLAEAIVYVHTWPPYLEAETLIHELGHLYDYQSLDELERAEFRRIVRTPAAWPWWRPAESSLADGRVAAETFADAYASCGLGYIVGSPGFQSPRGRVGRQACALILRAALDS